MPRTLPWLAEAAKTKESRRATPSFPNRKRAATPEDLVDSDLNTTGVSTAHRREKRRLVRTPSTSPPLAPPDVEYMQEGYAADDIWMIVEDEFLSTAQTFTKHIHHAEYVKLKKLARSRGAGTLHAISRPTDGRMDQSSGLRLRLESEGRAKKITDGMRKINGLDESDEYDENIEDPQLAGLMTGLQRTGQVLTGVAKAKSNTRAAAGFKQSPRKQQRRSRMEDVIDESDTPRAKAKSMSASKASNSHGNAVDPEDEEDDDLDRTSPDPKPQLLAYKDRTSSRYGSHRPANHDNKVAESSSIFERFAQASEENEHIRQETRKIQDGRPYHEHSRFSKPLDTQVRSPNKDTGLFSRSAEATDFMARRRAAREKKEHEEKRKANRADDVPTFLI